MEAEPSTQTQFYSTAGRVSPVPFSNHSRESPKRRTGTKRSPDPETENTTGSIQGNEPQITNNVTKELASGNK